MVDSQSSLLGKQETPESDGQEGEVRPDADYAWAAGFVDGEGSFSCTRFARPYADGTVAPRHYIRLSATQKETPLLERLQEILGTGFIRKTLRDAPRHYCHHLEIGGPDAFRAATLMWPWLGERKKSDFKRALKKSLDSRVAAGVVDRMTTIVENICPEPTCGKSFTALKRYNRRFCSHTCYRRTWYRDVKKPRLIAAGLWPPKKKTRPAQPS